MSIENEAWDAVEKERGNYIDKKKLIEFLQDYAESLNNTRDAYDQGKRHALQRAIKHIESGEFDIKEDTP